ncbi:MAG: hypothetical protein LBM99_02760 [Bacillales bacterium]|jgi:hypothetical protein|nr:hypothetical protein [Bacillales bacterium]
MKRFVLSLFVLASCTTNSSSVSLSLSESSLSSESSEISLSSSSSESSESSQVKEMISKKEMLDTLKNTPYIVDKDTESFIGLSKPYEVGVDEDRLQNEVLYPVPEVFDYEYDLEDYGVLTSNANNYSAFNNFLNSIKNVIGTKKIIFGSGTYKFARTIELYGYDDLYFVGNNTEHLMTEWTSIYKFDNCHNIHFNNIDFDYNPSPTIRGSIVSSTNNSVTILVNDEFDISLARYNGGVISYGNYMEYEWNNLSNAYVPSGNLLYNSTGDSIKSISNGSYNSSTKQLTLNFKNNISPVYVGKVVSVAFTMYEYVGILFKNCQSVYLETVNFYCNAGMMIISYSSKDMYLNRVNMMLKSGSSRLMTATADGLHTIDNQGDLIVTNSIYENSHDDAMNICTFYFKVDSFFRKTLTISATSNEVSIKFNVGDVIQIFDKDSLKLVYERTIVESASYGSSYDLVLDSNIPTAIDITNYLVGNSNRIPKLVVDNCLIRNKRNRGILAQVQDALIKNVTFINVIHGPLMLNATKDVFSEGIVPKDITISNCKFIHNNAGPGLEGDVSAFRGGGTIIPNTITNINVVNNFFYQPYYAGVNFVANGNSSANNNCFYDLSNIRVNYLLRSRLSENIEFKDNFVYLLESINDFAIVSEVNSNNVQSVNNILEVE